MWRHVTPRDATGRKPRLKKKKKKTGQEKRPAKKGGVAGGCKKQKRRVRACGPWILQPELQVAIGRGGKNE